MTWGLFLILSTFLGLMIVVFAVMWKMLEDFKKDLDED